MRDIYQVPPENYKDEDESKHSEYSAGWLSILTLTLVPCRSQLKEREEQRTHRVWAMKYTTKVKKVDLNILQRRGRDQNTAAFDSVSVLELAVVVFFFVFFLKYGERSQMSQQSRRNRIIIKNVRDEQRLLVSLGTRPRGVHNIVSGRVSQN